MTNYEYKVLMKSTHKNLDEFLNWMASQGWRYLHFVPAEGYVFERPCETAVATPEPSSQPKATRRKTSRKRKTTTSKTA
jgi:hypothetical protein